MEDFALLATTSALMHYTCGVYGMLVVVMLLSVIQYGGDVWQVLLIFLKTGRFDASWQVSKRTTCDEQRCFDLHPSVDDDVHDVFETYATVTSETTSVEEALLSDGDQDEVESNISTSTSAAAPSHLALYRTEMYRLTIRDISSTIGSARLSVKSSPLSGPYSVISHSTTESNHSTTSTPPLLPRPGMEMNTRLPIPFENDFFVGHVYFFIRTCPEDPYWSHLFVGKRRMFWIQLQGKFKRPPQGIVYLGGELPAPISLGIFTKSLALVIMGIVQKLVGKIHYNVNGSTTSSGEELPFVSFPLYQTVDSFMETPEDEIPPPLGREDFGETEEARCRRRATPIGAEQYRVGPTYSFHFHTMYVDLTQWKTANLPGLSDIKLSTFFDSLPLRLVAYEMTSSHEQEQEVKRHVQHQKRYLFCFEVEYNGNHHRMNEQNKVTYARNETDEEQYRRRMYRSDSNHSSDGESIGASVDASTVCDSVMELPTIDRNARILQTVRLQYLFWIEEADLKTSTRRVHYVFRVQHEEQTEENLVILSAYRLRLLLSSSRFRSLSVLSPLQSLRFHAKSRLGNYSDISHEGPQVAMYLEQLQAATLPLESMTLIAFESALFEYITTRTQLQPVVSHATAPSTAPTTVTPAMLGVNLSKRDRETLGVLFEGVIYRFYTQTLVRQEVLVMTRHRLHFYRSFSSSPEKHVLLERVIGVQSIAVPYIEKLSTTDVTNPFAFAFQINTFAEEIVICVATEHARNTWIRVLLQECSPHDNVDRSLHETLSVCYTPCIALKPAERVILNARALFPPDNPNQQPLQMVESTLRSALALHAMGAEEASTIRVMDFLTKASALRSIDLYKYLPGPDQRNSRVSHQWSSEEQIVFFINLYHTILAHAMIAQGFPRSKSHWAHFQTHMCYIVGRDPFTHQPLSLSLAEIEHMILRARLPRSNDLPHLHLDEHPSLLPSSHLRWAGLSRDFRVSFALAMNRESGECGTVPVLTIDRVHEQLNAIVSEYLSYQMRVDVDKKTIYLPRICEWYRHDFDGGNNDTQTPLYCVRKLLGFLSSETELQHDMLNVLESPLLIHIKYTPFKYVCKTTLIPWVDKREEQN